MKIKLTALDTLFFRDGKPFSMGEETWADGIFPPLPSVFYGALRTLYFSCFPDELPDLNKVDNTSKLIIKELCMRIGDMNYYPVPNDIVANKDKIGLSDDEDKNYILRLDEQKEISSYPLSHYLTCSNPEVVVKGYNGDALISEVKLENYIFGEYSGQAHHLRLKDIGSIVKSEAKTGIGRNNQTLAAEEGKLYRVGMQRLRNGEDLSLDFVIDFAGIDFKGQFPQQGFMKLGGENKSVFYEVIEESDEPSEGFTATRFKIVLTTPGIFKNGWYPDFLNQDHTGIFQGSKVKMIAASVGKAVSAGGFDMKKKQPKPMYKAAPAGSVYYLETIEGEIDIEKTKIKLDCLADKQNEGFGLAVLARINK